jgi:hypothetical protein
MAYVMIFIVLVAIVGVGAWFVSKAEASEDTGSGADRNVTATDVKPPAHPTEAIPGSDTARHPFDQP